VAALVTWLPFVTALTGLSSSSAALVAGLTLIAQLTRRLVGHGGTRRRQREEHSEQENCSFPPHVIPPL